MAVQLDHKSNADLFRPVSTMLDPQMQLAESMAKKAFKFFSAIPFDQGAVFTCQFLSSAAYNDKTAKVYAITLKKGPENAKVVNNLTLSLISPQVNMTGPEFAIQNMTISDFSVDCNIPCSLIGIEQQIIAKLDPLLEEHAYHKLMKFIIAQHEDEEPDPDDRFTPLSEILSYIDSIT